MRKRFGVFQKRTLYLLGGVCALGVTPFMLFAQKNSSSKTVLLKPVGNQLKYNITKIVAKAGTQLKIIFKNTATSPAMVHNVAFLKVKKSQDSNDVMDEVATAAIRAGLSKGYIPKHPALFAYTKLAKPGETKKVQFKVPKAGTYPFICLYPGHYVLMRGVLISK